MKHVVYALALCAGLLVAVPVPAQPAASAPATEPDAAVIDWLSNPDFSPQQRQRMERALQHPQMPAAVARFAGVGKSRLDTMPAARQFCLLAGYLLMQELTAQQYPAAQRQQAQAWLLSPGWCERVSREQAAGMTQEAVLGIDGVVTLYYLLYRDMKPRLPA